MYGCLFFSCFCPSHSSTLSSPALLLGRLSAPESLHISQVLQKLPLFASQALGFGKAPRVTFHYNRHCMKKVELNGIEQTIHRYPQICYSSARQRAEILMQAAKSDKCEISMKSMLTSTALEQIEIDGLSAKAFLSLLLTQNASRNGLSGSVTYNNSGSSSRFSELVTKSARK